MSTNESTNTSSSTPTSPEPSAPVQNWKDRFEELLKVKNFDDLKSELTKIAADIQTEIQNFDIHSHLSPTASVKIKNLETQYNDVMKAIRKTQKQFDREFNKNLRSLKKARTEAEKRLKSLRSKVNSQKEAVLKLSKKLTKKAKPKKKARVRKTVRKKTK